MTTTTSAETSAPTPGPGTSAPSANMPDVALPLPFPLRSYLAQTAALRFHEMIDMINLSAGRITQLEYWQRCMGEVFAPDAVIRYSKTSSTEVRRFDFLVPLVPVLFVTLGRLGVVRIAVLAQELETQLLSNGTVFFDCARCTFTYHYPDGSYITHFVQLKGIFNAQMKIEWGDLHMHSFVPGVEWNSLERLVSETPLRLFQGSEKQQQQQQQTAGDPQPGSREALAELRSHFSVFRNVSVFGSQEGLMRVSTVMSSLRNIWMYQRLHGVQSPLRAMQMFVQENRQHVGEVQQQRQGQGRPTATATGRPRPGAEQDLPQSKKRRVSSVSPRSGEQSV